MSDKIQLLDIVALTVDLPNFSLHRGQVGTIVEVHSDTSFEVEFVDQITGRTYGLAPVDIDQLLLLHYAPIEEA